MDPLMATERSPPQITPSLGTNLLVTKDAGPRPGRFDRALWSRSGGDGQAVEVIRCGLGKQTLPTACCPFHAADGRVRATGHEMSSDSPFSSPFRQIPVTEPALFNATHHLPHIPPFVETGRSSLGRSRPAPTSRFYASSPESACRARGSLPSGCRMGEAGWGTVKQPASCSRIRQ